MCRFITVFLLLLISSCASGPSAKIRQKDISFSGGNFEYKSWDDSLKFKRTSWYVGATMAYDLWLARIDKNSPFTYWMENNREQYQKCREFYVALLYTSRGSRLLDVESPVFIKKQIAEVGFETVTLSQFRNHMAVHTVFQQWNLKKYKIAGFCYNKQSPLPKEIPITLPGYNTINALFVD